MRSAVEKNVKYVGYPAIDDTTHDASTMTARQPARSMAIAAARPHGPAPTTTTSVSKSNDLISPRSHTDVGDSRVRELLNAIEIPACLGRQVLHATSFRRRPSPALHPLVPRPHRVERHQVTGEFREQIGRASCRERV